MLSLIEQIKSGALWDFPGGVHPQENKKQSNQSSIAKANIPNELVIPLKQHIGKPGDILVTVGERVLKGQPLSQVNAAFMLPIHAPTSGTIKAIEPRTIAHPSGLSDLCIVIEADQQDEWFDLINPCENYLDELPESLIERIRLAGISGMGGAGFPTARKIQSGLQRTEILILNAAECEPYITADDRLMQDKAQEVIEGIKILNHILKPKLTIIGIEDNKPEAIKALEQAATDEDIVIRVIPTKYPSGGEKQLIKILTNLEVPVGGIPADIGLMVQNVGSAYAIKRAVCDGEPLIERVVTLTGKTFKQPRNVWALIGTPVQSLLDQFGYKADKKSPRLIMGGPMMGFTLPHANVPITKTANCILAPTYREIDPRSHEMSCIRCSQCAEACPASLLPQQLQWYAKSQEYDKCEELNLKDCIECGACAFVCPSEIPLVHYYRQAKAEIRTRKQESEAAERAKVRFEEKKARLERDKAERENRFKKAADDRRKQMKSSGGEDAIAAAIERVKAQKSTSATNEVKPAVAAAIARAKAKQAEAAKQGQAEPDNSEMAKLREERKRLARERKANKPAEADSAQGSDSTEQDPKKAAIAAALARAKAKKAAQQLQAEESSGEEAQTSKEDAVAAAIARAKARKQAATEAEPETQDADAPAEDDPKKAAVAAAIARAKARKQAAVETEPETQDTDVPAEDDPKKAAVAGAIARAKARKQAVAGTEPETQDADAPTEDDPKKAAVAAAIARAKARKQAVAGTEPETQDADAPTEDDPKKAAVAAAIARAKARKQAAAATEPEAQDDPKKAAVAAAVARAKARKQAAVETEQEAQDADAPTEEDPKKAAVAAAIARAKARKQAAAETEPKTKGENEPAVDDPKKAAVAAAIARAKARKIEKEQNNKENN
ncbi:electron transport complex subunit RsxC [Vibrio sp. SCSIO 43133]|uniref:electron transport complex subunit RsxC n=1 Tax=Vibrio sp. SCSIO 43133 TaxID=2802577 RepID=UPI0020755682|nr:electron transport complex subunit RsxC [Vibrio sp. SCSIO 43133]USD99629.1 electron transport complex subunit RsxC [Vibrio sp. SCSIO 43133]